MSTLLASAAPNLFFVIGMPMLLLAVGMVVGYVIFALSKRGQ